VKLIFFLLFFGVFGIVRLLSFIGILPRSWATEGVSVAAVLWRRRRLRRRRWWRGGGFGGFGGSGGGFGGGGAGGDW
jgi:uncharacterized membrane protein YgcG